MELRAHLLLQVHPGHTAAMTSYLQGVPGVVAAQATSGPFDTVAQVAVSSERELQKVLMATRSGPGLARLCLCRPAGAPA